jgi:hypothetical protein
LSLFLSDYLQGLFGSCIAPGGGIIGIPGIPCGGGNIFGQQGPALSFSTTLQATSSANFSRSSFGIPPTIWPWSRTTRHPPRKTTAKQTIIVKIHTFCILKSFQKPVCCYLHSFSKDGKIQKSLQFF